METDMKILAVFNFEREDIIEAAKHEAGPYLDRGDWLNAWLAFDKHMRDNDETAKDVMLSAGTCWIFQNNDLTVEQVREYINGFK